MIKLKAILVDDESENLDVLEYDLNEYCPSVSVVSKCNSAKEGLISIKKENPDIIFLDINMPGISGLEMVEMLPEGDYDVIFTTAYEHYAVKAFKTCAVDYLLKPIQKSDLVNAVQASVNRKNHSINKRLSFLTTQMEDVKNKKLTRVMLPTIDGLTFIDIDDMLYVESDQNYTNIYLEDERKIFVMKSLKFMEEILFETGFSRIHKSYLVNFKKIFKYIKSDGGSVIMKDGKQINVSRTRKQHFAELLSTSL